MRAHHNRLDNRRHAPNNPPEISISIMRILIMHTLFIASVLAIPIILSTPALAITVTAPASVTEGETLSISASGAGQITISKNGIAVATGNNQAQYNEATNSASAGPYSYIITSDDPTEVEVSKTIEIIDNPLIVTILSPSGSDISVRDVVFGISTNWPPELCYVTIDGDSHSLSAQTATQYGGTFQVSDGIHAIEYKCKLGTELSSQAKTIRVDTTPPSVVTAGPAGEVNGPFITLNIDTNELSRCRYGSNDVSYDQLPNQMSGSYVMRNTAQLNMASDGSQTYFVRCVDTSGNVMDSSTAISFSVKIPPTAKIEIDGKSPLKAGTYRIKLTTSADMQAAPKIIMTLQDSGKQQQVALTGDDSEWTGYVIIPAESSDTVMSFSFEGISTQGVFGDDITEGSILTVDAMPPKAVDSITVDNSSEEIKLKWFITTPDDVVAYNIYRSDHEGTDYVDYYSTTSADEFIDKSTSGRQYYYYRVAAIDEAGNIGPLSREVYGSSVNNAAAETEDAVARAIIDAQISAVEAALLDINSTISRYEQTVNSAEVAVIHDMRLIRKAEDIRATLEDLISQLYGLKDGSEQPEQTERIISESKNAISKTRQTLINRIMIVENSETKQASQQGEITKYIPYIIAGNVDQTVRRDITDESQNLQDHTTITIQAKSFRLFDMNNQEHGHTFVRKIIDMENPRNDITILEVIPKEFSSDVGDIEFEKEPVVVEKDPIVSYDHSVLESTEFSYSIDKIVSLESAKNSKTLLYSKQRAKTTSDDTENSAITGRATLGSGLMGNISGSEGLLILLGVIIIIILGVYYVSLSSEENNFKGFPGEKRKSVWRRSAIKRRHEYAQQQSRDKYEHSRGNHNVKISAADSRILASILPNDTLPDAAGETKYTKHISNVSSAFLSHHIMQKSSGENQTQIMYSSQGVPTNSDISAISHLAAAESLIDEKEYDESLAHYKRAIALAKHNADTTITKHNAYHNSIYESAPDNNEPNAFETQTDEFNNRAKRIYTKLLLYKKLNDAGKAFEEKDLKNLRSILQETKMLAIEVGDENTRLINEAKEAYTRFVRGLNTIEIQKNEKFERPEGVA